MTQTIQELVKDFRQNNNKKDYSYIFTSNIADDFHREFKRQIKEDDKISKGHIYMLTFTIDPNKHKIVTDELLYEIEKLINSQHSRTALKVRRYLTVREYHKNKRPHWHALIITDRPLAKDRFNHYIKKYGNIDLSKSKSQQPSEIVNYMSKTGDIVTHK
jgi:hypothetical protein